MSKLAHKPKPEDAELIFRRAELAKLRATLTAREAELDHLRAQLNSFEGRYIRQVGVLYIQLDEWEDRIAQLNNPTPPTETAGAPHLDSEMWVSTAESANNQNPAALDLKALFREVAKRIHPDRARSLHDERQRTHLMSQANAAFLREDAGLLQRMLNGYDPSTNSGDDLTSVAKLKRVLDQIANSQQDILNIDAAIEALTRSEMAQLKTRTTRAALQGRDLLAEHAARVKGSIGIAMRRYELDLVRIRRKQPAFNPAPLLTAERIDS
jgi:hypothetical protein